MEDICGTTIKFIGNLRSVDEKVVSNTVESWRVGYFAMYHNQMYHKLIEIWLKKWLWYMVHDKSGVKLGNFGWFFAVFNEKLC